MKPAGLLLLAAPFLLTALCACRQGGEGEERSLARLERLAFVPAGEGLLPRPGQPGIDISMPAPLLVDRFEVTRGEWLEWLAREPGGAGISRQDFLAHWAADGAGVPATWMSAREAARFARDEGLRLPTAREWMHLATGGFLLRRYPWGSAARSVSNVLELGLGRLAPVGTFENGRSVHGLYDLVGNAAEWVEGSLEEGDADERTWAAGGSYLDRTRPLFVADAEQPGGLRFHAALLVRDHRGRDIGLRVCAAAEPYLRAHAAGWPGDAATRARLRAIGRRWGSAAVPLLERLAREPHAPESLGELLAGARR